MVFEFILPRYVYGYYICEFCSSVNGMILVDVDSWVRIMTSPTSNHSKVSDLLLRPMTTNHSLTCVVTLSLALYLTLTHSKDFGFCWGVERSIALAYEAVEHFPDRKLHITNELIHNPEVKDKLLAMNVNFIEKVADGAKDFSTIGDGDVVILPAFGASFEEMQLFNDRVRLPIYL